MSPYQRAVTDIEKREAERAFDVAQIRLEKLSCWSRCW
jgi:hypothetical protein